VRTLIEDVAERLGTCGMLSELIRERVGRFALAQAISWERLRTIPRDELSALLVPAEASPVPAHA
jgi:tRNA U55 pseudouridine synthase TruB